MKMHPIKLNTRCVKGSQELVKHMRLAMYRNLPSLRQVPLHDGEAVLVGSGMSVEDYVGQIREHSEQPNHCIFALKAAHDFLLDNGIRPHAAVAVDPQEKIAQIYKNPQHDIRYFISSQCHPAVFDALKDYRVILWHLYTKSTHEYWSERIKKKRRSPEKMMFIGGGTTTGMRAISLAAYMGYQKINLYGFDSCIRGMNLKIDGSKAKEESQMVVVHDGKGFHTTGAMAQQSHDFYKQVEAIPNIRIKAYGDGLIPWMTESAARRGHPQFLLPGEDWRRYGDFRRGSWTDKPIEDVNQASEVANSQNTAYAA